MDAAVLQRRPLPNDNHNGENKETSPYRRRRNEKAEKSKGNLLDDENKKSQYYYYIRLNGPSLFPWRRPKTLPRIKRGGNVKNADLITDKDFIIPSLNRDINNDLYFLDVDGASLKNPVVGDLRNGNSSVQQLHCQNLNDNDLVPEFVRFKPWKLQLLEQQQKQLNQHNVYDGPKQDASGECFMVQLPRYLDNEDNNEIEMKMKRKRNVGFDEIEDISDEMLPDVSSFKINKCEVKLTDAQTQQSLPSADNKTNDEDEGQDLEDNFFMKNGNVINRDASRLNLKGFFMDTLPLCICAQQFCMCLTSVDLSFNNFKIMPDQLFLLTNVASLNMRNNPLTSIPKGIKQMKKLKHLNLSFCLLTKVSKNICSFPDLQVLDISHNSITSVHENIYKLVSLKDLFIDGNKITIFPRSMLKLNLKSLYLKFNFTHKIFWKETCPPVPQRLFDISMMTLLKNNLFHEVPDHLQVSNISRYRCAYCDGAMVGAGISVLKPVAEIFGVKDLPLLFYVCSQTCRVELQHSEEPPSPI